MFRTTSALVLGLCVAAPALAETLRPQPRPQVFQLSAAAITPAPRTNQTHEAFMLLFQATSFVSAAGVVTGMPLLTLPK